MIVGLSGFIGSGKDTVADIICKRYNFNRESFADNLKNCLSTIFNWDRTLLEGKTENSRKWRETVDQWWASRLNIENFTPRYAMQHFGTDVCRNHFYDEIWIASLEKKILENDNSVVISDARFLNELRSIKRMGGYTIRIKRDNDPDWFETAIEANYGDQAAKLKLKNLNIHPSEYSWAGYQFDAIIENDGTIEDLENTVVTLMENLELNRPVSTANLASEVAVGNWHKLF